MATLWTIIQFIFVFGLIIFVHELGHYLAAVFLGIPVAEFGFGYPPRLLKLFRWRGTDFTLNAIPFGGFVRFEEEVEVEDEEEPKSTADGLIESKSTDEAEISPVSKTESKVVDRGIAGGITQAPKWKRFIVLAAGATMNFILGILILIIMFNALGTPDTSRVKIADVAAESPAALAGLQKEDIFVTIDKVKIESTETLSKQIQANLGKEIEVVVLRNKQELRTSLIPRQNPPEGQGAIGIVMDYPKVPARFGDTLKNAFGTFWDQVKSTLSLPVKLIQGAIKPEEARLVGIKGIYDMFSYAEATDKAMPTVAPITRLTLVSVISIAVGITNLLPIPALDGGQILFLLIEAITGKKMNEKVVNIIVTVFFFLLILLMLYITLQDFINPIRFP